MSIYINYLQVYAQDTVDHCVLPHFDDVSSVKFQEIVVNFPHPTQHGGTTCLARDMIFPVVFGCYSNVPRKLYWSKSGTDY